MSGEPIDSWNTAGEQPGPDPIDVGPGQARHPRCEPGRVCAQPLLAVEHVLQHVIGRIADVGLRIDDQPRFALRGEDVVGMKVGTEQNMVPRGGRQFPEQRDPGPRQSGVDPSAGSAAA